MAIKCPKCGLTQMPKPACKSCGVALYSKVPRSTAAQVFAQQPNSSVGGAIAMLTFSLPVIALGVGVLLMTLAAAGISLELILAIALVPLFLIFVYQKPPARLTQEPAVIRIESFPKSNGSQIAGVITRYTGIYGVDDLLKKLPVEFDLEAETSEDLKSQLQQLGCI